MKRHIAAGLSVLAVAAGVGWKVARHPGTPVELQQVSLRQNSEHTQPGSSVALARVRVRVSPSDSGYEIRATADKVPRVSLAAE
jgi:hypothetical protein